MLRVWDAPETRPTRDIDLLGFVQNDVEHLVEIIRGVCQVDVDDDGLHFDATTVGGERIKEDADYEGVRIRFRGTLEKARIPMQIDIGFGDAVYPSAQEMSYPTLLDFPAPRLRMYPRETVVAEKLEAMVFLGTVNSRMKDFSPAATSKSPIRGRVKLPQVRATGRGMITRCEGAWQLVWRLP
jgi:hypothetical protein